MSLTPTPPLQQENTYKPQLDSLRALAVLLVVASHWVAYNDLYFFKGRTGVLLFFVLSGYLITGILLGCREQAQGSKSLLLYAWKRFTQRRILRIFPLYYAVMLLMLFFGFEDVRQYLWWHVTYLSNVLIALNDHWYTNVSHFWSLAIEEQFYIVWPVVILFMPHWLIRILLLGLLLGGPVFRFILLLFYGDQAAVWVLPFSVVDSLGLGALFAYLERSMRNSRYFLRRFSLLLSGIGILLAAVFNEVLFSGAGIPYFSEAGVALYDSIIILILSAPILLISLSTKGWALSVLSFPPLVYLGKISYGIYIFHIPVKEFSRKLCAYFGVSQSYYALDQWELVLVWSAGTLMLSILSWHFLEKRINRLKVHFPYQPKAVPPTAPIVPVVKV